MELFHAIAVLITLAAVFSYINHRFIGLPSAIGLMLISLLMSLVLLGAGRLGLGLDTGLVELVRGIDFNKTLMVGMLSFLLFAGALQLDLDELIRYKWRIASFATLGVVLCTFIVGTITYYALMLAGVGIDYMYCLLFGAIISPTDPIAVLGILRNAGAPHDLEVTIAGESLFNDGVGVVVFLVILGIITGEHDPSASHIAIVFAHEALGGILVGLALGYITYMALKSVDQYEVEVLLTLALVTGGYALAMAVHTSGPIAIVVAGLLIGNHGRKFAMSDRTREHLDMFWRFVDEILNSILFVLIGLELLVIQTEAVNLLYGLMMIPLALLARAISVGLPVAVLRRWETFSPHVVKIMTWGGLRGGISVALALSLPESQERTLILSMTYTVVVFSILVQGLSIKALVKKYSRDA